MLVQPFSVLSVTTTDLETAELLSAYFEEVYTVEDMTNLPMVTEKDLKWSDAYLAFGETEVMEKLQKLKTDKSPGPDDIHPLLLKECAWSVNGYLFLHSLLCGS